MSLLRKEWHKIVFMVFSLLLYLFLEAYFSPPPPLPPPAEVDVLVKELQKEGQEKSRKASFEKGRELFYYKYLGSNGKSCSYCHEITEKFKDRMKRYPFYWKEIERIYELKERIIACINGALKGPLLKEGDERLDDLEMFLKNAE